MKVEISALFGMDYSDDMVRDIHIGDGVHLQEIKLNRTVEQLAQRVKESNEKAHRALVVREEHEWHRYTHRFFVSVNGASSLHGSEVSLAKQLIMRAIVLSRIVKPMPIPLHPTLIYAVHNDSGEVEFSAEINVGFYSTAYVVRQKRKQSISQGEAELMAKYWPASQHIYDNRDKYRRIYRSLMTFNDAYHIRPSNISHVILHAALESLICTSPFNNKRQVTKRLPQLVSGVTEDQAVDIYEFCCDVKHAAAPGLLYSKGVREMDPRDRQRYEAVERLETSLRALFIRALEDRSFAEEMEDKTVLAQKYPIPKK